MTKSKQLLGTLVGAAVAGGLLWMNLQRESGVAAPDVARPAVKPTSNEIDVVNLATEEIQQVGIETAVVEQRSLSRIINVTGRVQINQDASARVGSIVEGRVARLFVTVGDSVQESQPLLRIHSHELPDARAALAHAQAELTKSEKALSYASAEKERADRLLNAKAISLREQLQATANLASAEADFRQAQAEMERAEEFLHHLSPSEDGEDVVVRAPAAGVVLERHVSVGTVVTPATDLIVISNLTAPWVVAEVPEREATSVHPGLPVWISVPAFPDERFDGKVDHIGESLDPQTRTVRVRAVVNNRRQRLRPEMYANIRIDVGRTGPVSVVAVDALQEVDGAAVVFVETAPGAFAKREVETGRQVDSWVEVLKGLEPGMRVVTRGAFLVKSQFMKSAIQDQ